MEIVKEKALLSFSRLKQNAFVKSVLTISSGIAISQGIGVLLSPIYTRIYAPSLFGDYSVMISSGTILSSIICLGLLTAIMLPKDDETAKRICTLIMTLVISLGTLFLAVALIISPRWQAFSVDIPYWQGCLIVYFILVLTNISSIFYSYTNRLALYRVLFWNPILGAVSNAVLTVALGLAGWGLVGYSIGTISASVVSIIYMSWHVKPFRFKSTKLMLTLKANKNFPLLQLPANIISTFSLQLPVQMLSRFFGSTILGIYSITMRCLDIPTALLAAPINRVYYRDACAKYAEGQKIGEFTFNILKASIKLAIIPITILMVFGEPLFAFIFGEKWRLAGAYAEVLGVYSLVAFCSACISGGFVITGKQKYNLLLSVVSILANAAAFIFGNLFFGDAYTVLIFFAVTNIVIELGFIGWFVCSAGVHIKKYLKFVIQYIFIPSVSAIIIKILLKKARIL